MWEKIKYTIVVVLATLGVLFIVIMLLPDDEASESDAVATTVTQTDDSATAADDGAAQADEQADMAGDNDTDAAATGDETSGDKPDANASDENTLNANISDASTPDTDASESNSSDPDTSEASSSQADTEDTGKDDNTVTVNIPSGEISKEKLTFKTVSLDNDKITQDIFSGYDITVVHVWGTFCGPCIAEMGDYADFYKDLPDNVNMIAIICDVYDGIDSNVSEAKDILKDAGADFTNLRTSDDLYDVIGEFQYVPSSFFVDGEGHIIGSMMDGVGFEDTKKRLEGYLE